MVQQTLVAFMDELEKIAMSLPVQGAGAAISALKPEFAGQAVRNLYRRLPLWERMKKVLTSPISGGDFLGANYRARALNQSKDWARRYAENPSLILPRDTGLLNARQVMQAAERTSGYV